MLAVMSQRPTNHRPILWNTGTLLGGQVTVHKAAASAGGEAVWPPALGVGGIGPGSMLCRLGGDESSMPQLDHKLLNWLSAASPDRCPLGSPPPSQSTPDPDTTATDKPPTHVARCR